MTDPQVCTVEAMSKCVTAEAAYLIPPVPRVGVGTKLNPLCNVFEPAPAVPVVYGEGRLSRVYSAVSSIEDEVVYGSVPLHQAKVIEASPKLPASLMEVALSFIPLMEPMVCLPLMFMISALQAHVPAGT